MASVTDIDLSERLPGMAAISAQALSAHGPHPRCRRCRAPCARAPWRTCTELVDQRRLQLYQRAPQYSVTDAMSSLAWVALAPRSCVGLTSLPTELSIRLERLPTIWWEKTM
jgi:hypothetical protein